MGWVLSLLLVIVLAGATVPGTAEAIVLRDGLGGPAGFGELSQLPNDDGSSNELDLPFTLNFFGNQFSTFFINNNGNITFNGAVGSFTPEPFPITDQPMIAPYWADVDTRCANCGAVYVGSPNPNAVVVTWNNVGYFRQHSDKLNDFQLTLINRPDTGAGNFDIEFRYNRLEWTTGDASDGEDGLGGTPAQAGYDAGLGPLAPLANGPPTFFTLPGSFTPDVLDLVDLSNVSTAFPGLFVLPIRSGAISDGSTPDNPLIPIVVQEDGFHFEFNIELNQQIFIDPLVAIGYDYIVDVGPNILTAVFPTIPGDTDGYDLFGFNGGNGLFDILLGHVNPGEEFLFGPGGVSAFGLRDIDGGLDPTDVLAFVTGLTFAEAGFVQMRQVPFTIDVQAVPLPSTLALVVGGLLALGAAVRKRR